jgi:hypothetical protein
MNRLKESMVVLWLIKNFWRIFELWRYIVRGLNQYISPPINILCPLWKWFTNSGLKRWSIFW